MIGNDIIDLNQNIPHPRFAERITSAQEKAYHDLSQLRHVWELWAIKESAYKALMQKLGKIPGNPRLYEVSEDKSQVSYRGHTLEVFLQPHTDYIFAQAFGSMEQPQFVIGSVKDQESLDVRELCQQLFLDPGCIIKTGMGIPIYITKNKTYPISLTHHQRFIAASRLSTVL